MLGFRYLPVMISRIILSLKKAAAAPQKSLALVIPTTEHDPRSFQASPAPPRDSTWGEDGICLEALRRSEAGVL